MTYQVDPVFGCRLWTGKLDRSGYATTGRGREYRRAYELAYGPIPAGLWIDHICQIKRCIAPIHLEAVTPRENALRQSFRYRLRRERCKHGHTMADGIITDAGGKVCRTCRDEQQR